MRENGYRRRVARRGGGGLKLRWRDWVKRNHRRSADWEETVQDFDGWR